MEKIEQQLDEIRMLLLTTQKNVWNINECAYVLGISKDRLYHLVAARAIPHYKCCGHLRFKREEIEAYQCNERVVTLDELDNEAIHRIGFK